MVLIARDIGQGVCHVLTYGSKIVVESICNVFLVANYATVNYEPIRDSVFTLLPVNYFILDTPNFSSIIVGVIK